MSDALSLKLTTDEFEKLFKEGAVDFLSTESLEGEKAYRLEIKAEKGKTPAKILFVNIAKEGETPKYLTYYKGKRTDPKILQEIITKKKKGLVGPFSSDQFKFVDDLKKGSKSQIIEMSQEDVASLSFAQKEAMLSAMQASTETVKTDFADLFVKEPKPVKTVPVGIEFDKDGRYIDEEKNVVIMKAQLPRKKGVEGNDVYLVYAPGYKNGNTSIYYTENLVVSQYGKERLADFTNKEEIEKVGAKVVANKMRQWIKVAKDRYYFRCYDDKQTIGKKGITIVDAYGAINSVRNEKSAASSRLKNKVGPLKKAVAVIVVAGVAFAAGVVTGTGLPYNSEKSLNAGYAEMQARLDGKQIFVYDQSLTKSLNDPLTIKSADGLYDVTVDKVEDNSQFLGYFKKNEKDMLAIKGAGTALGEAVAEELIENGVAVRKEVTNGTEILYKYPIDAANLSNINDKAAAKKFLTSSPVNYTEKQAETFLNAYEEAFRVYVDGNFNAVTQEKETIDPQSESVQTQVINAIKASDKQYSEQADISKLNIVYASDNEIFAVVGDYLYALNFTGAVDYEDAQDVADKIATATVTEAVNASKMLSSTAGKAFANFKADNKGDNGVEDEHFYISTELPSKVNGQYVLSPTLFTLQDTTSNNVDNKASIKKETTATVSIAKGPVSKSKMTALAILADYGYVADGYSYIQNANPQEEIYEAADNSILSNSFQIVDPQAEAVSIQTKQDDKTL